MTRDSVEGELERNLRTQRLRDFGYNVDYLEQPPILHFLKMVDEYRKPPHNRQTILKEYS